MLKKTLLLSALALSAQAAELSTEQRVERIENQLNFVTQMNQDMSQLQDTVLQLNGQLETLTKDMENLKEAQSDLRAQLGPEGTNMAEAKPRARVVSSATLSQPSTMTTPEEPDVPEDQAAYQAAYEFIGEGEFEKATAALNAFLQEFSESTFQAGAHYWLGEMYSMAGKSEEAIAEFQWVLHAKGDSLYAPEAAFKLGMIYNVMGDKPAAKKMFSKVIKQFPKTKAATNAKVKLRALS